MSLKIKEVENIQELFSTSAIVDDCCPVPLFHGTRQYALQVTDENRNRFCVACDKVMSFAKKLALAESIDSDELFEYQRTQNEYFLSTVVYMYKSSNFEYGDFYLTTSYSNALGFSKNSGGELGEWAYNQCIGFKYFDIKLDEEIETAASVVAEEYKKYRNSEMTVLVYSAVKFEDLLTQKGMPFLDKKEDGRIIKYMEISDFEECEDTGSFRCQYTFRLTAPDDYCAVVLRENNIKEGFSVFTEIDDVDKYLESHQINI